MRRTDALLGEHGAHFAREERLAFPAAEAALGRARLEELGAWWAAERGVHLEAPEHAGA
jgi:hypothetical protein